MCGIAGIVGEGWQPETLSKMTRALQHRGPDGTGVWNAGVAGLGHTRLAIIDPTSEADQPMISHDGKLVIVHNGEIYNYLELRAELRGYPFRTQSDTEVILAAYQWWGVECVKHFIGQFAFAIWDERRQTLFCARDQLGIKPFFYTWHNGRFLFASEVKALLAAGVPAKPDLRSWARYLVNGVFEVEGSTFFEGIYSLEAGCLTCVDPAPSIGNLGHRYWCLRDQDAPDNNDSNTVERFLYLMRDALKLSMRADSPVVLNRSTGLDSNALLYLSQERFLCFQMSDSEAAYIKEGIDPLAYQYAVPLVMRAQEAPFGGIATIAYHFLHQYIRDLGYKVALEGQGADELLGGYDYYQRGPNTYQDGTSHLRPSNISPDLRNSRADPPHWTPLFSDGLTNMLHRDLTYTKLPRVLRMNDRLSMASGVELREPYLDPRLVAFCFSLPPHMKIRDGVGKWLLRESMKGLMPEHIRTAPKRGDTTPQRRWLKGPLRPWIEAILHSPEFAGRRWFDVKACQESFQDFCEHDRKGENSFWIWQWVNAEYWCREFIDTPVYA